MKPSSYSVRLDEKIILTMFLFCVFACFITAFRYKSDKPCEIVDFSVTSNKHEVDHYISFTAINISNADSWQWDYGDKTPVDKISGPYAKHIYKQPGEYEVTLTINGKCTLTKNININGLALDSIPTVIPQILWPVDPVLVGQAVLFRDLTNGATRWEWYIGEGEGSVKKYSKELTHTFTKPGSYNVTLFVNGFSDSTTKKVIRVGVVPRVIERPVYNGPPVIMQPQGGGGGGRRGDDIPEGPSGEGAVNTKYPPPPNTNKKERIELSNEDFFRMVQGVINKTYGENNFTPYLCGKSNIRVLYNGQDISLQEALENLKNGKRLILDEANAFTSKSTGCIESMSIRTHKNPWYKKYGK
jgi:PKD repeat protein